MLFSHFGGGLKSPTRQSRSGDGAPPRHSTGGFTLNGFTPPVDALRHGRYRKPFTICSYEKCARNSLAICTYKSLDLNFFGINTYKKQGWGVGVSASRTRRTSRRILALRGPPPG